MDFKECLKGPKIYWRLETMTGLGQVSWEQSVGYACDARVWCVMCAWPACHYVITRPGATSAQHRGLICYNYNARQNTPVSIWREERGDHKPQCLERIYRAQSIMIMRTYRSRCLGISANVSTDVDVNFEASEWAPWQPAHWRRYLHNWYYQLVPLSL